MGSQPDIATHLAGPRDRPRARARALRLGADQLLVDLACGAGGPGLWVASESGARLAVVTCRGSRSAFELGAAAAATVSEASVTLEVQPYCGHVLAVAERR